MISSCDWPAQKWPKKVIFNTLSVIVLPNTLYEAFKRARAFFTSSLEPHSLKTKKARNNSQSLLMAKLSRTSSKFSWGELLLLLLEGEVEEEEEVEVDDVDTEENEECDGNDEKSEEVGVISDEREDKVEVSGRICLCDNNGEMWVTADVNVRVLEIDLIILINWR